jgi:hypothetical protein
MLEMQPYMWLYAVGADGIEDRKAFAFKVTRLPLDSYDVRIAEMGTNRWKILVTINGKSEGWRGRYASAPEAFEAVQTAVNFSKEELDESRVTMLLHDYPDDGLTWGEIMQKLHWSNGNTVRATIDLLRKKGSVTVTTSQGLPPEQVHDSVRVKMRRGTKIDNLPYRQATAKNQQGQTIFVLRGGDYKGAMFESGFYLYPTESMYRYSMDGIKGLFSSGKLTLTSGTIPEDENVPGL